MNIDVTADELKNSFPLDDGRRFDKEAGRALVAKVRAEAGFDIGRVRARKAVDEKSFSLTLEVLLANLVAAGTNVIDHEKFVAVGFAKQDYVGSELSRKAMADCRDGLQSAGLIDVFPGFSRPDIYGESRLGYRTRLRATERLRSQIAHASLGNRPLSRAPNTLIKINRPHEGCESTPVWLALCQDTIQAVNARIAASNVELPKQVIDCWSASTALNDGEDKEDWIRRVAYRGDMTATAIYRVFTGDWRSGGRFYGGWWMGVPSKLRRYITIGGQPVVELDYKTLHPRLLFNRKGIPLTFDPYTLTPQDSVPMRALGKRTVNRLLNRKVMKTSQRLNLRPEPGDDDLLPKGLSFTDYRDRLINNLQPISEYFGIGAGVNLQYEDSELALEILGKMEEAGITVLSVHDSFLVQRQHEQALRSAMERAFYVRYAQKPEISKSIAVEAIPTQSCPPPCFP